MSFNNRIGTFSSYDTMLRSLASRQKTLADAQEQVASGKRVIQSSDDPAAASLAERALQRIDRINSDLRALNVQKSNISLAESTLGDALSAMQRIRELTISAGNGSLDLSQQTAIANEIHSLRNTLLGYANRENSNGMPLFGGLGSAEQPFKETSSGVVYTGLSGQYSADANSIPYALDGYRTWMLSPTRDGVFDALFQVNQGNLRSTATTVQDLGSLRDTVYTIDFAPPGYVIKDDAGSTVASGTYNSGQSISFDGLALTVSGQPVSGDQLKLTPTYSIFQSLDKLVSALSAPATVNSKGQSISQALSAIDASMNLMQASRGQAGEYLNLADRIDTSLTARSDQLEKDRGQAVDLDMAEGISRLQTNQTAYEIALKSYAQFQKLTLFNYLD